MKLGRYHVLYRYRKSADGNGYVCKIKGAEEKFFIVTIKDSEKMADAIPFISQLKTRGEQSDFIEDFLLPECYCIVFAHKGGQALQKHLNGDLTFHERGVISKNIIEALIMKNIKPELSQGALSVDNIIIGTNNAVSFAYTPPMPGGNELNVMEGLASILEQVWACSTGAEYEKWLEGLKARKFSNICEAYSQMPIPIEPPKGNYFASVSDRAKKINPANESDYWEMGRFFIKKKPLITACTLIVPLIIASVTVLPPIIKERFGDKVFIVNSPEAKEFSGQATLLYPNGKIAYIGDLLEGSAEGNGTKYNEEERVMYKGEFKDNIYQGQGKLYNENGGVLYKGEFKEGVYDGAGILRSGELEYDGEFSKGEYEGKGVLKQNGAVIYEGDFKNGIYDGSGILYENGIVTYEGGFKNGIYHGNGFLYENGELVYEGEFRNGLYHGSGKLYNIKTGRLIYSGDFGLGIYEGNGKLYDDDGHLIYEGGFLDGLYEGQGTLYDENSGEVLFSGRLRSGNQIAEETEGSAEDGYIDDIEDISENEDAADIADGSEEPPVESEENVYYFEK